MTRLLERLEHLLDHRPHLPTHRSERRTYATDGPATAGFQDCRGEWHFWDEE